MARNDGHDDSNDRRRIPAAERSCAGSSRGRQMAMLDRVILKGFKSIKAMDLELRRLNILIGANGAGKSNLVSFFKMLNEMMAGRLQQYIGATGRAQSPSGRRSQV